MVIGRNKGRDDWEFCDLDVWLIFPFVVGWEGGVGGGRYTEGVSTTLGISHVEIISRRERDDRVSQNPLVCLIFPFIARREGVAVPVAGLASIP